MRNTDLEPILASKIIGDYWEQIRLKVLGASFGEENVFIQVPIEIKGAAEDARIDAVIIESVDPDSKTVTIRLEEDKTGRAVLSEGQQTVHDLVKAKPNSVHPELKVTLPPEVLARLRVKDSSEVTVIISDFDEVRARTGRPQAAAAAQ